VKHYIEIRFINENCSQIFIEIESILNSLDYHIKLPCLEQCRLWQDDQGSDVSYDLIIQTIKNQRNASTQFWMYSISEEFGFSNNIFVSWSFEEKFIISLFLDGHDLDSKKEIISCMVENYFAKTIFYDAEICISHD
jgi:hypothetical protein